MQQSIQKIGNRIVKFLLNTPFHGLVSGSLMLITFTGRKSGKIYTTPVQYGREGNTVTFFSQKQRSWWKNLLGGAPVNLRLQGRDVQGTAEALPDTDEATLRETLKRLYPKASQQQMDEMLPRLVLVRVQLDPA